MLVKGCLANDPAALLPPHAKEFGIFLFSWDMEWF